MFLGVFLYAILFIGNFYVSRTLDGEGSIGFGLALCINLALLITFAVQHSGMARPKFKSWLTRFIPKSAERSTYVLFSNVALILMFLFWQPMGGVVWAAESEVIRSAVFGFYFVGWIIVFLSTFAISHFDLFGLRQVWMQFRNRPYQHHEFQIPNAYKIVRHPLYVGWITVMWAAPTMTVAHLVFAVVTTTYILIAIQWEERDLIGVFGDKYKSYRQQVPMLVPVPRFGKSNIKQSTKANTSSNTSVGNL